MKRITKLLCGLLVLFVMTGCSSSQEKSVDESFIDDFKSGLMARWDEAEDNTADSTEEFNKLLDAELNEIKKYKDETFENKELGESAKAYINNLEDTKNITKYVNTDYSKFYEQYQDYSQIRAEAMYDINKIQKIKFDSKSDQDIFDSMLEEGELVKEVRNIMSNTQFTLAKNDNEYDTSATYEAIVENTTNTDFDNFYFDIAVKDEQGVIIDTESAYTENWRKGEKHKFDFWLNKPAYSIEITRCNWD